MSQLDLTEILNKLIENIRRGECILFLGAGVHAPPPQGSSHTYHEEHRPPLGGDLAERLAEESGFKRAIAEKEEFRTESPRDLQRVSLFIHTTLGRKELLDYLVKYLREGKQPSPALRMLARLPFKIIVTTNFDHLLESALREKTVGKDPAIFVYDPRSDKPTEDMTEDPTANRPLLFKMHGDLDQRDSIVITDEDYVTFVQRMSDKAALHPVPETVRYRMLKWPMLFVGYSLRDYNLRLLFRTLRWRIDEANFPRSFAVDRTPDPLIRSVWQDERKFIVFVTQELWTFVPWLFKEVRGEEFADE